MNDRLILLIWLLTVVGVSLVHAPHWLALYLLIALVGMGRAALPLLRTALLAVLLVNLAVSLGYVLLAHMRGMAWIEFVLRLNLRVLLLTVLTLWVVRHVDLLRAVSGARSLSFLVVLTLGHIQSLRRVVEDFRVAFTSRSPIKPGIGTRYRALGTQTATLLEMAEQRGANLTEAMRSRGFFDDRA